MGRARLSSHIPDSDRARLSISERERRGLGLGARLCRRAGRATGVTVLLVTRIGLVISFVGRGGLVSASFQTLALAHVRLRIQSGRLACACVLPLKDRVGTVGGWRHERRGKYAILTFRWIIVIVQLIGWQGLTISLISRIIDIMISGIHLRFMRAWVKGREMGRP